MFDNSTKILPTGARPYLDGAMKYNHMFKTGEIGTMNTIFNNIQKPNDKKTSFNNPVSLFRPSSNLLPPTIFPSGVPLPPTQPLPLNSGFSQQLDNNYLDLYALISRKNV